MVILVTNLNTFRIGDYSRLESLDKSTASMGFGKLYNPVPGVNVPTSSFVTSSDTDGLFDGSKHYGFDFNTNYVNNAYLSPYLLQPV